MTVRMLGRYEIVSQLGRGAMGTVYRALDPAIERTVAIKTLNPDLPDENMKEVKERFLREAKSAGRLNHPNVVTVYDVGEADGVAYIAMEYLEGRSLREILDSGTPLPLHSVANIVAQIADALDYAQRFGIVHRDIKPANIMISPAGVAKLTDFGVAYMPSSSMTQTGTVLGSPKYLSPEQVLGLPVDGRSDIFGLGIVLFEMLTRRTPFEKADITVYALMQRICTEPLPRVSELDPAIPPAFDTILARALSKRPDDRYQRAGEFASDLRNYKQLGALAADKTMVMAPAADKTLVLQPDAPRPAPAAEDPEMKETMDRLLQDLDAFSTNLEEESQRFAEEARIRAEAEARARSLDDSGTRSSPDATAMARPRSALIGMLQEQAKAKAREKPAGPSLESVIALSERMRKGFEFLAEFVREFNAATPTFAGKLSLLHAGTLPESTLGSGFVDYRSTHIGDREVVDYILLTYRMASPHPVSVTLNKAEARILKLQLERAGVKYHERDVPHSAHRVPQSAISIECSLVARARFKADYNSMTVEVACHNVGTIGASSYRIGADGFGNDAVEEFGKRILGFPNRFTEFTLRT